MDNRKEIFIDNKKETRRLESIPTGFGKMNS